MIWWFIWMSLWIRRHILVAYFSSSEKWLFISLRCSPGKLETESWASYMSYSINTQCKFDDYHSKCFKLIQQLITTDKFNFNFVFTFGMYFITPATQKNIQRVFQNIILVGNVQKESRMAYWCDLYKYTHKYTLFMLSVQGCVCVCVCVCVCMYIHKIHWLFYSLFIYSTNLYKLLTPDR